MVSNRQIFNKTITEVISSRTSMRSYNGAPLDKSTGNKLMNFINQEKGPFGSDVRFRLTNAIESNIKLGTYGFIKGTSTFIVSAIPKADSSLMDLGYLLERGVLYATDLNLGTCWLGGTFNKGQFAEAMELTTTELLPVVIPVGYPSESRRGFDSFVRFMARSKDRKSWSQLFFKEDFNTPLVESHDLEYLVPLGMLRLAPSAANKQPWRIVKSENSYDFYLEHNKNYSGNYDFDFQKIDMGIAMCHFDLTSKELGLKGFWKQLKLPSQGSREYIISWVTY